MLTPQEKHWVRKIICSGDSPMLTPELLKAYAEKSDEEVRTEIETFKESQRQALRVVIDQCDSSKEHYQEKLTQLQ